MPTTSQYKVFVDERPDEDGDFLVDIDVEDEFGNHRFTADGFLSKAELLELIEQLQKKAKAMR